MPDVTYDTDPQKARRACRELLSDERSPAQPYVGFHLRPGHPHADIARHVEAVVFGEAPFDNSPEMLRDEYAAFEAASDFYLVVDAMSARPVGAMRVISHSSAGLKTLKDVERAACGLSEQAVCEAYELELERVRDIGTLAVIREHRGTPAGYVPALMMFRMFYRDVVEDPTVDHVVTILDRRVEARFEALRFPFLPMLASDHFPYLGSPESRALVARTQQAEPQLAYWLERFRQSPADELGAAALSAILSDQLDGLLRMSG